MSLKSLLDRGYFPKELPSPPFTTTPFSNIVAAPTGSLPPDFANGADPTYKHLPTSKIAKYSHARGGLLRRKLGICNPLHYYLLAKEIVDNWAVISSMVSGTAIAATAPELKSMGRAIEGRHNQGARAMLAQKNRLGRRFLLETDISRFYSSIYTHSIPWALHTKAAAKINRGRATLLGNNLDYLVRMGQDGQTIGIPIGPDTSLVLAELLMQRCDAELITKIPKLKGHRFIDDYELSFYTRTEAEDAFHLLERALGDYELALNPKKTKVLELPLQFEASWVTELRSHSIRVSASGQAVDMEALINKAFHLHKLFPGEAVLSYAIAKLRVVALLPDNWELFQRLLLLCVTPEPATFPYAIDLIIKWVNAGYASAIPELHEVVNTIITTHAPLAHSSEVSHALWASIALGVTLGAEAVAALSMADDSVVALMALDCESRGLMSSVLDKSNWQAHMTSAGLYEEHWLLSYEANIKGWLPSVGGGDHVAGDPNFGFLKASGVYFYDTSPLVAFPIPAPTLPTQISTSTVHSI
jgi:hypothetical protein